MGRLVFDTIAAIATPRGSGGLAVVRVSGPKAVEVVAALVPQRLNLEAAPSHTVHHAWLHDGKGRRLDEALVTVMRAPRTFTGENVVEIGVHGGNVVARRVADAVLVAGARLAERGEFTKRAFLNGRIDLSQAEAIADLVAARTERAADSALAGLAGRLAERTRKVEGTLLDLLARLELNLDFNEDVEAVGRETIGQVLRAAIRELDDLHARAAWGKRLRDGVVVILTGDPNVGKSSLFNTLLEEDRALVSEAPGTTRDYLEAWIDLGGVPVRLLDTAGLRSGAEGVEAEGVRRARRLEEEAHLRLQVVDATSLSEQGASPKAGASVRRKPAEGATLVVGNKCDLLPGRDRGAGVDILVSAKTGEGVAELRARVARVLAGDAADWEAEEALPGERHDDAIRRAVDALSLSRASWEGGATEELIAGDVRDAATALGEITGRTVGEEVLERIFSRFCIGK